MEDTMVDMPIDKSMIGREHPRVQLFTELTGKVDETTFTPVMKKTLELITNKSIIHPTRAVQEVNWFYNHLGLHQTYFVNFPESKDHADLILAIYGAKMVASTSISEEAFSLLIHHEAADKAMYGVPSYPYQLTRPSSWVEYRIESHYMKESYNAIDMPASAQHATVDQRKVQDQLGGGYRVQSYRTTGTVAPNCDVHLRLYFVIAPKYVTAPSHSLEDCIEVEKVADSDWLAHSSAEEKKEAHELMEQALSMKALGRVIIVGKPGEQLRLVVCMRRGSTHNYFSGITALYTYYGFYATRKTIETFANGFVMYQIFLDTSPDVENAAPVEQRAAEIEHMLSGMFILPRTAITPLFRNQQLCPWAYMYAYCGWKFVHQFLNSFDEEYCTVLDRLRENPANSGILARVQGAWKQPEARILEVIVKYPELIAACYEDFAHFHKPGHPNHMNPADEPKTENPLVARIRRTGDNELDIKILLGFLIFNRHIMRTNFYRTKKVAIAFRLDGTFLSRQEFPLTPYAVIFFIGAEFRGFHVRFQDVARGGIRVVVSRTPQQYNTNLMSIFEENYNLANTQQRKNKDIPEGGSKGTILLSLDHPDKIEIAFKKYVTAVLDICLPNNEMLDYLGKPEILFLGPDEYTAELMTWASQHARKYGYSFWKAFTTGKKPTDGGIPHDAYGMTTRSVRMQVLGLYNKLHLDETKIVKLQTGGPDGDLGSNEILLTKDITKAIVDGSGVVYDPKGLDRVELTRLAKERKMIVHFDRKKLSKDGYLVLIEDKDVTLPDGTKVDNGLVFRNNFHLTKYAACDIFVPCGGRPKAVNESNIMQIYDENTKKCLYGMVVEGANLFFTEPCRKKLHEWGVLDMKDATANKGGVTSSSFEVLCALAMNDEEFFKHFCVSATGVVPEFYSKYVKAVIERVETLGTMEFEALWREHLADPSIPMCTLSDLLSNKINDLTAAVSANPELWNNMSLRKKVLAKQVPQCLQDLLGLDLIMQRVPENYLKASFCTYLASRYVYKMGVKTNEFAFYAFISEFL